VRGKLLSGVPFFLACVLAPAMALAQLETEPNDSKAQANPFTLPAANATGVIVGNSISAATTGLDYFRVTTAAQPTPGFYRHRLIITTTGTAGHTGTIRGLSQTAGTPNPGTDITFQTSSTATTPPRFVQWYTSQDPGQLFVRITGTAATTADYSLDYEVQPVTEVAGPGAIPQGSITITAVGQGHTTDTDLWIYDANRAAIPGFGNDDTVGPPTSLQSTLTRTYTPGPFHMAISNFQLANNLGSPPDDNFLTGTVMDFPGVVANSSTTANLNVTTSIGGTQTPATKAAAFDVVFVSFTVVVPVELTGFSVE
jgi:hypothetical protein